MAAVRMTRKQAAKYTGETPAETVPKPAQKTRTREKPAATDIPPAVVEIGERWRVVRRPDCFDNPPGIGTVCRVWQLWKDRVFLLGDGYSFDLSRQEVARCFVREEDKSE